MCKHFIANLNNVWSVEQNQGHWFYISVSKGGEKMGREKESYRDNLELLIQAFPDKNIVCCADIVRWSGRNKRLVKKLYFTDKQYITVAELERKMI